jgi:hypothetical protein
MTVVEAYFGGKKMDSPDNAQMLSADVTSLIVEGIAQNTSGSIFETEVSSSPFMEKEKAYVVAYAFEISAFSKHIASVIPMCHHHQWLDKRCILPIFVLNLLHMHAYVVIFSRGNFMFISQVQLIVSDLTIIRRA